MTQSFVRVPPQSTGKRVLTTDRYLLQFDNMSSAFIVGTIVTGATSGATGEITSIDNDGYGSTTGALWLTSVVGTFVNDENIQVDAVTHAVANITGNVPFVDYSIQNVVLADPNNPTYKQKIDRYGASINSFSDGAPIFGSFGTLMVGEPQVVKDYRFAYDGLNDSFWDDTSGTGSISYDSDAGIVLLSVGTASGALAKRTSNFYHPYSPGVGKLVEMTIRCGDTGKANNVRRWGYFDDDNGAFFELDGTEMCVVIRSKVSGTVVEERIPQSQWNHDPLDGTDNIGFDLDVSSPNFYWIDFQWLGAGRVRFGIVEPSGTRLLAHVMEHANEAASPYPYMRTATLPIRLENVNTGATGSTSEMRFACAVVKHASSIAIVGERRTFSSGLKTVTTTETPILAVRPKTTYEGQTNRAILKILAANMANITNTGAGPVVFKFYAAPSAASLTGAVFASAGSTSVTEVDTTATAIVSAQPLGEFMLVANDSKHIPTPDSRELHTLELFLNADGITQPILFVTAQCLSGTNANVYFSVNCEEIKY